uniref:Uncharacterized protein n=1 Tax=Rhizophora mucronata TaxID=61149 RepID=A0A2P2QPK5_RHIMU
MLRKMSESGNFYTDVYMSIVRFAAPKVMKKLAFKSTD